MKKYIDEHLGKGFIRPSSLAAASLILLVRKPGRGLCFWIDYRALNAVTVKNRFPIPLISETLGKLAGAVRYTKLDVIHAFNRIQMKEGHKWLTAFNSRYGQFEYLVMPFGLCNAPGTFQGYINESLREYLDVFCTAYLDDVLIYSGKSEDHAGHVLQVLRRLHKRGLQVDIDKCEFNTTRVKYIGMIVTTNGIEMDTEKVEAVQKWEAPSTVKEVQAFLGFANFYRQFISNFARKVKPLNKLTKRTQYTTRKGTKKIRYEAFEWNKACQQVFKDLKRAFTTAPVLAHYDSLLETWVETDASDFVVAGVLSQKHGEVLKPVAYFFKKMNPAECNYMIYNKKLLAIVRSFETWRPELASVSTNQPVKVLTDHQNLEHFMTTKQLNCRQARWAEFLSEFDFKITYRPGKEGEKPDTLTRLAQDRPKESDDSQQQHQFQTVLKASQLDDDIKKALAVMFYTDKVADEVDVDSEVDVDDEVEKDKNIVDVRNYINQNLHQHSELEQILEQSSSSTKMAGSKIKNSLEDLLDKSYQKDEIVNSIIAAKQSGLWKLPADLAKQGIKLAMGDLTFAGSGRSTRLYVRGKMYVPNEEKLQLFLLQQHHNPPTQGHPEYKAIL